MATIATMFKNKWFTPPGPATESFAGRTVLVTGSTSGLGYATALKFAQLGAEKVILTARDAVRGAETKARLQALVPECEFAVWLLDMQSYASVVNFAKMAEKEERINIVVLNAGVRKSTHALSPEGWEEDIQVNLLSTILLGIQLLPVLKNGEKERSTRPVLLFVNTGFHATAVIPDKVRESPSILEAYNDPSNFSPQRQYAHSKLLLMHATNKLAARTNAEEVIVTSVCPGAVATNLARDITFPGFGIVLALMRYTLQCTPEQGADAVVNAAGQEADGHGRLWKNDAIQPKGTSLIGEQNERLGVRVWEEVLDQLRNYVPKVSEEL